MKNILKRLSLLSMILILAIGFNGCEATQNANNKQKGAVIGAAGGAILGASAIVPVPGGASQ